MDYFKPKSFLLSLRNVVLERFTMEQISTDREPLRYKVSGSLNDYAFLFFETVDGRVTVGLDFSPTADQKFVDEVSKMVETVLKSDHGHGIEIRS